ncbi:MFS transporter [Agromyces silvae]|uniref:potassium transporter Trk n=1 Tax=Agromyces silvae TaxID=3388266 RepID=UPI00280C1E31|nr:potassium transporter Trk [Agromyces protaetiae]
MSNNHHDPNEPHEPLETEVTGETVNVRRAPRYGRFILLGAGLGIVLALILTFAFPENDEFDRGQVFGFLLLGLGTFGVAFGAVAALIFDRVLSHKSGLAIAEHEQTHHHPDSPH